LLIGLLRVTGLFSAAFFALARQLWWYQGTMVKQEQEG
jgi:hypothetical protein